MDHRPGFGRIFFSRQNLLTLGNHTVREAGLQLTLAIYFTSYWLITVIWLIWLIVIYVSYICYCHVSLYFTTNCYWQYIYIYPLVIYRFAMEAMAH
jgi:hypothetical protein